MNAKSILPEKMYSLLKDKFGSSLYYMPRKYAQNVLFREAHGYEMDWKYPKGIDEKQRWLLAYSYGRREAVFADKYKVREYVTKCGYGHMLTEIYGVYRHSYKIDINQLPEQFVLKTNHDCASNIICRDKSMIDWEKELAKLEHSLHINYANRWCEYHYRYIKRCIIAEQFLDDGREERLTDYKIHCFYGKPHCVELITDRSTGYKENFFDIEWNSLDYAPPERKGNSDLAAPESLNQMLEACEKLARPFPYVRMDFYDINGKAYFGEITLTPSNVGDVNEKGQQEMGKLCILPSRKEIFKKNLFGYQI